MNWLGGLAMALVGAVIVGFGIEYGSPILGLPGVVLLAVGMLSILNDV